MPNDPLVSISCITYNQEAFIADAIEGFLRQEAPFPIEILIHDDASTDRTAEIVRSYEQAHPDRISAIYQHENQYSKGVRTTHFNFARARGKYIALCEGDDFWTDPLKLAKQVEAMEAHPGVELCFHAAQRIPHGASAPDKVIGRYADRDCLVSTEDIITRPHGAIPTASCVITNRAAQELMRFRAEVCGVRVGDVVLQILASLPGGALYLAEEMSVYRYKTPGSWSSRQADDCANKMKYARDRVHVLEALDAYSNGRHARAFADENRRRILGIAWSASCTREQKWAFYREFASRLNPHSHLMYLFKALSISPNRTNY